MIASTWCADVDQDAVLSKAQRVIEVPRWSAVRDSDAYPVGADEETRKFVRYWFDLRNRKQLAVLSVRIARIRDRVVRSVLWCALSRLIIVKQAGVSRAMDVSHSRPHRVYEHAPIDAVEGFLMSVRKVLKAAPFAGVASTAPQAVVAAGDARSLPLLDASVDVVITSPPYLNAIDYLRGHRMSLVWMRHALRELRVIRSMSVGTEHTARAREDRALREVIATMGGSDLPGREQRMLLGYLQDMRVVVREIARVLRPAGRAVLVVGDCAVRGTFIRNSWAIEWLAALAGLRVVSRRVRDLPEDRRYLPPPTHGAAGKQLQRRMRQEVILTFQAAA
jgi:hypothetical protein